MFLSPEKPASPHKKASITSTESSGHNMLTSLESPLDDETDSNERPQADRRGPASGRIKKAAGQWIICLRKPPSKHTGSSQWYFVALTVERIRALEGVILEANVGAKAKGQSGYSVHFLTCLKLAGKGNISKAFGEFRVWVPQGSQSRGGRLRRTVCPTDGSEAYLAVVNECGSSPWSKRPQSARDTSQRGPPCLDGSLSSAALVIGMTRAWSQGRRGNGLRSTEDTVKGVK
ncbi:hypothetical protein P175DRAFT_0527947 [Aspergillus ochraceoroseus IBT 24754]|uniref:Uncharacterized protein n=1 Tax=Aspergillus ochraceoroseus IBT 24754 TaxID=1392256 RepID=A0A2T5M7G6_9EURO|nr:uncharacterized protein P175DRAFT_0527947 [Aspergillus ochraceoroseus IBT 24754]PTU24472.1 hypothetical protein P175DRAFT_0527947 [Aspergillus ochraceoroseus IBT 24754]